MKVLHVIDEITLRNKSIFSITNFYKKNLNHEILCGKNYLNKNVNYVINKSFLNYFKYFSKLKILFLDKKFNFIHIHGLWRPIYFFTIIYAKIFKINTLVQPHGMLLHPALKSGSLISVLSKFFFLKIYSLILKNSFFIAITKEEKFQIEKIFKKSKVFQNLNPISLNYKKINYPIDNINKKLIYLGRINKIKNIKLAIRSFVAANLDKKIGFDIYGIKDDNFYRDELVRLIKKYNNQGFKIKLKKPVDGEKKKKIISKAWCNILISESEVLSLSVQECLILGTPSIVNKKLYFPKNIKSNLITTDLKLKQIAKNINKVFKLSHADRKRISLNFLYLYNLKKQNLIIKNKQRIIYEKIGVNNSKGLSDIKKTFLFGFSNAANFFYVSFFAVMFAINGYPERSANIAIFTGSIFLFTQFFSANSRSLILSPQVNLDYLLKIGRFRVIISFFLLCLILILDSHFKNFGIINFLLSLIILFAWINENSLTWVERVGGYLFHKINIFINIFIYIIYVIVFYLDIEYIQYILSIHLAYQIFLLVFLYQGINVKNNKNYYNKINLPIVSSASFIVAILIWRFVIYLNYEESISGIIIVILSVASLPGTICQNILASSLLRIYNINFILIKNFLKNFVIISMIFITFTKFSEIYNLNFFYEMYLFSFIGSIILSLSIFVRQKNIFNNPDRVFKKDLIYNLIISLIPLILIYNSDKSYVSIIYFLSSLTYYTIHVLLNFKKL